LKKIRKLAKRVRTGIEKAAGANHKRRTQLLRGAGTKLGRLDAVITSPKTSISLVLSQRLTAETSGVRTALSEL
jgi:hypothetical protein